jgi:RHS repeat-associated protein
MTWRACEAIVASALVWTLFASPAALAQTSATRTSSFAYDPASGLLTQQVVEPNTTSLRLETDYVYDAFGNKTSVSVSGVDITTRTNTATYDAQGQFALTNANALNQSETWQYDPRFGTPTSHTGPNGLTTTWSYDAIGRKIQEVGPDGTQTKWAYLYCSGVNGGTASCPTNGAYLIQATPLASDGATQNGPIAIVYFDTLDREIARYTQGFDGSTIVVSKQYDSLGRLQQQSRPYFASNGTPEWTSYAYDVLGRVVTETYPDSNTTQHAYHGLVTTNTNALGQTRTVTKDSQGEVVSVADAANQTTTYAYDPFGKLIKTADPVGNVVAATYDVRGRKTASADPDLGSWTYSYDTASELVSRTDAKSQTSTFSYDILGRLTERVEPDMTSVWVYDTAPNGIGKVTSASITAGPSSGYARQFSYDSLGRPNQVAITIDSTTYTFAATYDANSRLSTVDYPSGFSLNYNYTNLGYTQQLANGSTVYWTANARDAEMHLIEQTAGNGVVTGKSFDPQTGRLTATIAGSNNAVASFGYTYDALGNLLSRFDSNESLTETLTYDNLNRLTSATVSQNVAPVKTFTYDPVGNLLTKSDVGTYTYPTPGSPQPHAVTSIAGSAINTTFTYDPNGNETSGLGRSMTYASYNKPSAITQGSTTLFFNDDVDHQRYKQIAPEGNTLYFDVFGIHTELFIGATSQWNEYLTFSDAIIGVRFETASETITTRYFHTDHLGSIAVITDETGNVVERDSYDAWGKRRFPNGADDPTGSITSLTTRGFTDQEELADVGLVHLNGRVYDPLVGRMQSADPVVPDPMNAQTWNRYSYVANNPLTFTDPNGYCFLGLCGLFNAIGNFFTDVFRAIGNFFRSVPILGTIFQIAAVGICVVTGVCAGALGPYIGALVAGGASAFVTGVTTGKLGLALRAGFIAAATAIAFFEVGQLTTTLPGGNPLTPGTPAWLFNIAGHALVGCASVAASGGSCGSGALSGGITSAAGPFINNGPGLNIGSLVANAALGGAAAVAGGGKFDNGAITAAFGYLFNAAPHLGDVNCAISPTECSQQLSPGGDPFAAAAAVGEATAAEDATILYHGTDIGSAMNILQSGFDMEQARLIGGGDFLWTTTSPTEASFFALANPIGGDPALLGITVPNPVIDNLVFNNLLTIRGSVYQFEADAMNVLNSRALVNLVPFTWPK